MRCFCLPACRLTSGCGGGTQGGGGSLEALAVPSCSTWSVATMPPGLQPPQPQQHLGPASSAGADNLHGLPGHSSQLPPYAAVPRYGNVSQLLDSQGTYSPQGELRTCTMLPVMQLRCL